MNTVWAIRQGARKAPGSGPRRHKSCNSCLTSSDPKRTLQQRIDFETLPA